MNDNNALNDNRSSGVLVVSSVLVALSFVAFICRLLTRYLIVKNPGRDDLCIAIGWVCTFYHCGRSAADKYVSSSHYA